MVIRIDKLFFQQLFSDLEPNPNHVQKLHSILMAQVREFKQTEIFILRVATLI